MSTEELQNELGEDMDVVIIDVKYVSAPTLSELEKKTRALINKDWTTANVPVVIDPTSETDRYIQTMHLEAFVDEDGNLYDAEGNIIK